MSTQRLESQTLTKCLCSDGRIGDGIAAVRVLVVHDAQTSADLQPGCYVSAYRHGPGTDCGTERAYKAVTPVLRSHLEADFTTEAEALAWAKSILDTNSREWSA